jgi:hypothetical protein
MEVPKLYCIRAGCPAVIVTLQYCWKHMHMQHMLHDVAHSSPGLRTNLLCIPLYQARMCLVLVYKQLLMP